jgi:hypothetical protein
MRLQGRTLLVALSLLTSAATAYAECAWVLWRRETSMGYGLIDEKPWLLVRAAPTYNTCEVAQAEFIKKIVTFWAKAAKSYSCWITRRGCTLAWQPNQASPGGTGGKRRHPRGVENTGIRTDKPEAQ